MKTLVFSNALGTPKNVKIECSLGSVKDIMQWYGGFFAGDLYSVTLDGRDVAMDINGLPKKELTDG